MTSGDSTTPIAVWAQMYLSKVRELSGLINSKVKFLKSLQNKDIDTLSDSEARKTLNQIYYLEKELKAIWNFKKFTDTMLQYQLDNIHKIYEKELTVCFQNFEQQVSILRAEITAQENTILFLHKTYQNLLSKKKQNEN